MNEHPKKENNLNNSLYSKSEKNLEDTLFKKSPLINPSNHSDERIVKVPVRLVGGPKDEFFLLQIPENKLNISGFGSILKIEVVKTNEYDMKNVNMLNVNNSVSNDSRVIDRSKLFNKTEIMRALLEPDITESGLNIYNNISKADIPTDKNNQFSPIDSKIFLFTDSKTNSTKDTVTTLVENSTMQVTENNIYDSQNSLISNKPFIDSIPIIPNPQPFQNYDNSTQKRKTHRQRVLVYRGSAKHQPTSNSQKRWIMKKVVRRRIRPGRSKSGDDLQTSDTAPVADVINPFMEVEQPSPGQTSGKRSARHYLHERQLRNKKPLSHRIVD